MDCNNTFADHHLWHVVELATPKVLGMRHIVDSPRWLIDSGFAFPLGLSVLATLKLTLITAIVSLFFFTLIQPDPNTALKAPFSGSRFASIARLSYALSAQKLIRTAHDKYQSSIWKLTGNDFIILPQRYIEEMRALPLSTANAMEANLETLQGKFTNLDVLGTTRLFVNVLKQKLGIVIRTLRKELDECMSIEFPSSVSHEWTSVDALQTFHKVNGRISVRLSGGPKLRDFEPFLKATEGFLMNIFITAMSLPVNILIPYIGQRKETFAQRAEQVSRDNKNAFPDVLYYLIEMAEGHDAEPRSLAAMILSLSLASNQATTMALVETLFDLCHCSEYRDELREEVRNAIAEEGGWKKQAMTKMKKLPGLAVVYIDGQRVVGSGILG
ncbi:MAG: hypothetical protein M1828_001796 [Chrysothrix sp. TS-e1954]|nr:MAG: hypothetical protein M1828_001796 [Chrysothrix sp. TS-e1954]